MGTHLAVGEALVSMLNQNGQPEPVEQALIFPPQSRIGPLTGDERRLHIARSPLAQRYNTMIDRESAYEILAQRAGQADSIKATTKPVQTAQKTSPRKEKNLVEDLVGNMAKSAVRSIGSQLGRQIVRGLLGSLLGGRRR